MFDENTDKVIEVESAPVTDAPDAFVTTSENALSAAPVKKGYTNKTARLMNGVYIVSLIVFVASLCFQFGFSMFSYAQQGAPSSIAVLYSIVGMATPLALCLLPFVFKFFAELLELKANKNK